MDLTPIPRVLCIDGTAGTRQQVCTRLAAEGFAVLAEQPGIELTPYIDAFRPDLLLTGMPSLDLDALPEIMEEHPDLPVIVLNDGASTDAHLCAVWRLGVADVLAAPLDLDELTGAVRFALNRPTGRSFGIDDISIDEAGHLAQRAGHALDLTHTEFKLLVSLVTNAGIVLSKRQLLNAVWGFDDYDENLVEVYVSGLRRKLEQHGPRLIQTVRGVGYVIRGDVWGQAVRRGVGGLKAPVLARSN